MRNERERSRQYPVKILGASPEAFSAQSQLQLPFMQLLVRFGGSRQYPVKILGASPEAFDFQISKLKVRSKLRGIEPEAIKNSGRRCTKRDPGRRVGFNSSFGSRRSF